VGLVSVLLPGAVSAAATAAQQDQPVGLAATPIGEPTPYFAVTLAPGEQQELRIALENKGSVPIDARTYAADAYTTINGGLGAELQGDTVSATTTWLDYEPSLVQLSPDDFVERAFTVVVPPGTAPGDYVTCIVLEQDRPVEGAESLVVDTPLRQAVAVTVRVPGPLRPDLELGAASHEVVTERSVVSVAVDNPGNVDLEPAGHILVRDSAGAVVSRRAVVMGSLYASTATTVEVTLDEPLAPGTYTVDVALRDGQASATARRLPLEVAAPSQSQARSSSGSRVTGVSGPRAGGVPVVPIAIALLAAAAAAFVLSRRLRRQPPAGAAGTAASPAAAHASPRRTVGFAPAPLRPGTGRRRRARQPSHRRTRV